MKRFIVVPVIALSIFVGTEQIVSAASKTETSGKRQPSKVMESAQDPSLISGKVVDTMNSAGYTYVQLEKNGKKTWVAVPETKITKGQTMSFQPGMEMQNFESKTLKRKFDKIIFSGGIASQSGSSAQPKASGGSKSNIVKPAEKIKVEKASGQNAYSVSEVYAKKKSLEKKTVSVKGKVVKFSAGIMGMNWIHIQDGTGDSKKGSDNLVATTQETAAVGDVITVTGTLAVNKDFGQGYKYDLIVEGAKVAR